MKARVAMIASIGGVLLAGTAAAMVNTEVLRRDPSANEITVPRDSNVATTVSTSPTTVSDTTAATTPAPTVTTASTPVPPPVGVATVPSAAVSSAAIAPSGSSVNNSSPTVPTAATSGAPATFQLGDSGTVTLSAAGGALSIASVTPNPGWTVERAWQDGPAAVEVRMGSAAGEVRFEAALVRNVVVHSLEIDPDSSGSGSGVSGSGDDSSGSGSGDDSDSSGSGSGSSGSGSDDDSSGSGSSGSGSDD